MLLKCPIWKGCNVRLKVFCAYPNGVETSYTSMNEERKHAVMPEGCLYTCKERHEQTAYRVKPGPDDLQARFPD